MNEFFKHLESIKELVKNGGYCIVSNKVSIDENKIQYCYKEEPDNDNDSGWRFFAGDEDDEYCANPDNFHIFDINTLCNYDKQIIKILNAKPNSMFAKNKLKFIQVEIPKDEI